jgi:hypothetical protein
VRPVLMLGWAATVVAAAGGQQLARPPPPHIIFCLVDGASLALATTTPPAPAGLTCLGWVLPANPLAAAGRLGVQRPRVQWL